MNNEQFVYWLKGFISANENIPTEEQWEKIKENINLVSNEITPIFINTNPIIAPYQNDFYYPFKTIC